MKECPNCGYDLDNRLTKSEKQKIKEKAQIEIFRKQYPNDCYCQYPYQGRNSETDEILETDIYIEISHLLFYPRKEKAGPYNKRICSECGKFYIDNPILICG